MTRCSSSLLTAGSCAAPDTSANTSHDTERTQLSDSAAPCPPNMPLLLHGEAELRRLRLTLSPGRGSALLSPGSCSDKDRDAESCYETLASVARRSVTKRSGTDGALSSSGVWTASVSEGSDKEEDAAAAAEVRPKSSLSLGVVSSDGETRGEEEGSPALLQEAAIPFMDEADVSVHSCDTEGYYTTFHDFDGFQEVAHEYDFGVGAADGDSGPAADADASLALASLFLAASYSRRQFVRALRSRTMGGWWSSKTPPSGDNTNFSTPISNWTWNNVWHENLTSKPKYTVL